MLSTKIAEYCLAHPNSFVTKFFRIPTCAWSNEMAYRMGVIPEGNLLGKLMVTVGVPICSFFGKIKKYIFGDSRIYTQNAVTIMNTIKELDPQTHTAMLHEWANDQVNELKTTLGTR